MKYPATLSSRSVSRACILILVVTIAATLATRSRRASARSQNLSDISVLKSGDETAIPGGQIRYEMVVTNAGPDEASNVRLSDPIPTHTTFVNAVASQGSFNFDGDTVNVN